MTSGLYPASLPKGQFHKANPNLRCILYFQITHNPLIPIDKNIYGSLIRTSSKRPSRSIRNQIQNHTKIKIRKACHGVENSLLILICALTGALRLVMTGGRYGNKIKRYNGLRYHVDRTPHRLIGYQQCWERTWTLTKRTNNYFNLYEIYILK